MEERKRHGFFGYTKVQKLIGIRVAWFVAFEQALFARIAKHSMA